VKCSAGPLTSYLSPVTFERLIAAALVLSAGCTAEPGGGAGERPGPHAEPTEALPAKVRPFSLARVDVVLLMTGGTHGRLEVCNCPGPMVGGLSRRSGLARSYRGAYPHVVLLDSGDAFGVEPADLRNRYVLRGYKATGYDAVVLGAHEWAALPSLLGPALRHSPMTYLATNASPVRAKLPLARQAVYRAGRHKLAVLSFLGQGALWLTPVAIGKDLTLTGIDDLARRAAALKAEGCVVAVVAHVAADEIDALKDVKGVDLVIRGHTARTAPAPLRLGTLPLLKVGGRDVVAVAALQIEAGRIAAMEYRVEVVNDHWPIDRYVMDVYQAYAHEAMRGALAAKQRRGVPKYVPSVSCGRCHVAEYRAWRGGPHRQVWARLVKAKRTGDPNCVICHSSGFGAVGGFRSEEDTPQLAGVNCQDCHRIDLADGRCKVPIPTVGKDTCELCHTPINSPRFDFETYRPRVGCVRAHAAK